MPTRFDLYTIHLKFNLSKMPSNGWITIVVQLRVIYFLYSYTVNNIDLTLLFVLMSCFKMLLGFLLLTLIDVFDCDDVSEVTSHSEINKFILRLFHSDIYQFFFHQEISEFKDVYDCLIDWHFNANFSSISSMSQHIILAKVNNYSLILFKTYPTDRHLICCKCTSFVRTNDRCTT